MIKYFSVRHNLHILLDALKELALARIFQEREYGMFASFNFQMCLLSSVLFEDLASGFALCLKEELCTPRLSFQVVEVRPVYVSTWPVSSRVTVAW